MTSDRKLISLREAQAPYFVGIDLGGTNIKFGLVDDQGESLAYLHVPTEVEKGPEDGARRMGTAVASLAGQAGIKTGDIARVGLATPGTMDIPAGMLLKPHNLPGWFDFPIRDRVSHHAGLPVTYANDANAAAYGEFGCGTGREYASLILLTLGTGVGGGVIIGDLVIDGEHSAGGEAGHITIDCSPGARMCPCGRPGHLEAYASATAVVNRTREALAKGAASSLSILAENGDELTALRIAQAAEGGDEFALEIVLETARYLGIGIATLVHVIDPAGVVLGGAMTFGEHETELGRRFLARVKQEVVVRSLEPIGDNLVIDFATLGGDAGYIGAAGLARIQHKNNSRITA